jgi:hypothetical protein
LKIIRLTGLDHDFGAAREYFFQPGKNSLSLKQLAGLLKTLPRGPPVTQV